MKIILFNSLSKKLEHFYSIKDNIVTLYSCGPTVYNYAHLGNLRAYLFKDLLIRILIKSGYLVKHIMNITNVGHLESNMDLGNDKIEIAAQVHKTLPWKIARYYSFFFLEDCSYLHILYPSIVSQATNNIQEIQKMINYLILKKVAYNKNGNIYFAINKYKNYGRIFNKNTKIFNNKFLLNFDKLKENKFDFVLWFSHSKFKHQIMKWRSPWGLGFPGWHIECSEMASKYLGINIDIHTGGIDHIVIHHTNEIAQSEICFKTKWVNFWVHSEFLKIQNKRMSKSNNNFLTLENIIKRFWIFFPKYNFIFK